MSFGKNSKWILQASLRFLLPVTRIPHCMESWPENLSSVSLYSMAAGPWRVTERYNVTHRCLWVNMRIVGNLVILCHTLFFQEASDTRLFCTVCQRQTTQAYGLLVCGWFWLWLREEHCTCDKRFLVDRQQYVNIGNFKSSELSCDIGCPQGCVLSPVLFSIYTDFIRST